MMDRTIADAALIEAARSIAPLVRACRDEGERERRLPVQVVNLDAGAKKALADEILALTESTEVVPTPDDPDDPNLNLRSLARSVYQRKGSWWQLPKDYPPSVPDHV